MTIQPSTRILDTRPDYCKGLFIRLKIILIRQRGFTQAANRCFCFDHGCSRFVNYYTVILNAFCTSHQSKNAVD